MGHSNVSYEFDEICDKGQDGFGCEGDLQCVGDETLYEVVATYPDGHTDTWFECFGAAVPSTPTVTPAMVRRAFERVPLPKPVMGTNPVEGRTMVNFPTIFFTEAEGFSRDLTLLGQRVHLEITPSTFRWALGEGEGLTTDWPGRPFQAGVDPERQPGRYVLWKYAHEGTVQTRVTVVWTATFSVNGGPTRAVPGTVTMASEAVPLEVAEAGQVLVGADGR